MQGRRQAGASQPHVKLKSIEFGVNLEGGTGEARVGFNCVSLRKKTTADRVEKRSGSNSLVNLKPFESAGQSALKESDAPRWRTPSSLPSDTWKLNFEETRVPVIQHPSRLAEITLANLPYTFFNDATPGAHGEPLLYTTPHVEQCYLVLRRYMPGVFFAERTFTVMVKIAGSVLSRQVRSDTWVVLTLEVPLSGSRVDKPSNDHWTAQYRAGRQQRKIHSIGFFRRGDMAITGCTFRGNPSPLGAIHWGRARMMPFCTLASDSQPKFSARLPSSPAKPADELHQHRIRYATVYSQNFVNEGGPVRLALLFESLLCKLKGRVRLCRVEGVKNDVDDFEDTSEDGYWRVTTCLT
ncbi:hypothetical protein FA13DRAFT_1710202 [Coprinellus micaceus]|uniref:Uncharacterized protein n=1 Tax=Coprinellus micaceus TaxID=71717 RepID=A0A4Y7T978_COPMI|nr:hypothetical protein FA13DRAFT_1710202 [Coprinellus micaceus]